MPRDAEAKLTFFYIYSKPALNRQSSIYFIKIEHLEKAEKKN